MNSQGEKRPAALTFILLTLFIDILGIGIIIPVLPELIKQFVGGNTAMAGWYVGIIGASYSLMQFLCAPILGALSDRFGRRPVILAALFGLGVDFLIQGFAPSSRASMCRQIVRHSIRFEISARPNREAIDLSARPISCGHSHCCQL